MVFVWRPLGLHHLYKHCCRPIQPVMAEASMDQSCSGMSHRCLIGLGSGDFECQVDDLSSFGIVPPVLLAILSQYCVNIATNR